MSCPSYPRIFALLCVLVLMTSNAYSQVVSLHDSVNTVNHKTSWERVITTPAILISAGLITATDNDVVDRYEIHEERNKVAPAFHTHVDDYLQYASIAAVCGLNAVGIKGEHNIANQAALLIKSEIIMTAIVFPLKKITAEPRPDTGERNSFPSGHTAQAFAAATFLHKEYGREHPWYSVLAYGSATAVGVLRVMNNRHWASDVLAGAGIGILATNLAYLTHQNKWGTKHKKLAGVMISPTYGQRVVGLYIAMPIR